MIDKEAQFFYYVTNLLKNCTKQNEQKLDL